MVESVRDVIAASECHHNVNTRGQCWRSGRRCALLVVFDFSTSNVSFGYGLPIPTTSYLPDDLRVE